MGWRGERVGFIGRFMCTSIGEEGSYQVCERRCQDINFSHYFKFLMISLPKLALLIISSSSRMKDVYIQILTRLINTSTSTNPNDRISLKRIRARQRHWRIFSQLVRNQMLKSRRPLHPRCQLVHTIKVLNKPHQRRMAILASIIPTLLLQHTLTHPGGDQQRRHADAEAGKVECDVFAVGGFLRVGEGVAGGDMYGRGDVVAKTAVFVKGEDEEGFFPLRGRAKRFVNFLDEGLAFGDGRGGVKGLVGAAFGVDVGERGEFAAGGVSVELGERLDVLGGGAGGDGPLVEESIGGEAGGVRVVDPGDAFLGELLEDGFLWEGGGVEVFVVATVAVGGPGGEIGSVGVGWAWDCREPAVEQDVILGHGGEHTDFILSVVVDGLGGTGDIGRLVG